MSDKVIEEQGVKVGNKMISQSEYDQLRSAGKIIFRPEVKNGQVNYSDGRTHNVDAKGTRRNLGPRVRMNKKKRLQMRREAFAAEESGDA